MNGLQAVHRGAGPFQGTQLAAGRVAISASLRRMQNPLASGSASTTQPVPSGLCRSSTTVAPSGIKSGIIRAMAMTLRLDDQETEALRRRAELEGRSMQEVAKQAVRDYIDRTSRRDLVDRVLDEGLPPYAEALRRLGE